MNLRFLRVECDGERTKVLDRDTGEELAGVQSIRFLDGVDGLPRVVIEVARVPVSIEAAEGIPEVECGPLPEGGPPVFCSICAFEMRTGAEVVRVVRPVAVHFHRECHEAVPKA